MKVYKKRYHFKYYEYWQIEKIKNLNNDMNGDNK